jgi:hypothetical protein
MTQQRRGLRQALLAVFVFGCLAVGLFASQSASASHLKAAGFNQPGNVLIADQFDNRVIEVDPATHQVVWSFGDGSYVAGPHSVVGVNDAERIYGGLTLIAGTGTPAGADPSCPLSGGCPDNRVMVVNQQGQIIWQYGQAGVTGAGFDQLNTPVQATALPNGQYLITDQGNARVIQVNKADRIVWQYGQTGNTGSGPDQLNNPNSAELLPNGHILIADESNNRVIEVTRSHQIVAAYTDGGTVSGAAFASRLPNGDTLISDSNNNRAVEVNSNDQTVWQYVTNTRPGSYSNPLPTRAVRLANGDTLISDQFNDQVIEVTHGGSIVWSQGQIDTGNSEPDPQGFNLLNAPYDAKVIGDYTGLTPPPTGKTL